MVKIIIIRTSGDLENAVKTLNRMKKRLPKMTIRAMKRWGRILEKDIKNSAKNAGISPFSGTLTSTGIRYEQGENSKVGRLIMRQYGIYLDSMRPHFVSIKASRTRLLSWAKVARSDYVRMGANLVEQRKIKSFSMYVRPHPFIASGYRKARSKLRPVIKRAARSAIQSS